MSPIYFDIETAALPDDRLRDLMPPFNADDVKVGNVKDPEKVAARIEEARANQFDEFKDRAALSPVTGRVVAIGTADGGEEPAILDADGNSEESAIVAIFFLVELGHTLIGYNTHHFDLPFLVKRAWTLGVPVPESLFVEERFRGRRWFANSIDLAELWQLGDSQARAKLDTIARHFGIAGKTGDHGAHFATLWRGTPEERATAAEYLHQDVRLCRQLHRRMRIGTPFVETSPKTEDNLP